MEGSATSHTVQPWWERRQLCRDSTAVPSGCHEGSFFKLECVTEPSGESPNGVPTKRCVRLIQRLIYCKGQPVAPVHEQQDFVTLAGEDAELPLSESSPFGLGPSAAGAAGAARDEGEGHELEALLQMADELHEKIVPGALQLDPPALQQPASRHDPVQEAKRQGHGSSFFSKLLGRWQARPKLDEKTWEDYAKEFQEV